MGRIAWEAKLEGILVPSVRQPGGSNLAIFPSRRLPGSSWRIVGARDLPKKSGP
ncbi:MAG: RES family NAD+ phosphorylase [Planctomycetes bacterium]|nr:RES family NAD+ phosphorylase [Planctomycetota bacterium]